MTRPLRPNNPLARYLLERGLSASQFRDLCRRLAGLDLSPQVLHRWVHGESTPRPTARMLIARVTCGGVPADAWLAPAPSKTHARAKALQASGARVSKTTLRRSANGGAP